MKDQPPQCLLYKKEYLVEHILLMDEYVQRKRQVTELVESRSDFVPVQEDQLIWCPVSMAYIMSYEKMYAHVQMSQIYDLFPQELKNLERLRSEHEIETAIGAALKFIKSKAKEQQEYSRSERQEELDEIGYISPSESEVEFERMLTREEEEAKDIPQWTNDVLGRAHEVKEWLLAVASCPMFHMDFKYQEIQDGPSHKKNL